jgi:urease accessory protein
MIFEKIIGTLSNNHSQKELVTVPYEWDEASKKIHKKVASSGEEIGLRLSEKLYDGAIVFEDNQRVIALSLVPCEVTRLFVSTIKEMGTACFELGNRHLPLSFGDGWVDVPYDRPTFVYLQKKGFKCEMIVEKFVPEVTVKGHRHD